MKLLRQIGKLLRVGHTLQLASPPDAVTVADQTLPVIYRRHARAKNYVLRLCANKTVVVTMPRRGTILFAREFVASRQRWLEKQWRVLQARKIPPLVLQAGMEILFRGAPVPLRVAQNGAQWQLQFGEETAPMRNGETNLRPVLEARLQALARTELVSRTWELARGHGLSVKRIMVRNQRSRWGSCSRRGTISLNWRLIQLPPDVCDYIILHELMHLRQLNHSPRFWNEVASVCPNYAAAEEWLKKNSGQVGF